jgi:broad specificity phosphatase PhoE
MLTLLLLGAAPAAERRQTVHVMRHLDTPKGARDPELTEQGRRRAEALSRWFRGKRLRAIYVTDFRRTRQTVAPLAARLKMTPKLYDPRYTPALIERVRRERGAVLVVGHSNTVPDIVEGLGGARPAPLAHPDFGDLWTVRDGKTERTRLAG